jgi:hypothetical protein
MMKIIQFQNRIQGGNFLFGLDTNDQYPGASHPNWGGILVEMHRCPAFLGSTLEANYSSKQVT